MLFRKVCQELNREERVAFCLFVQKLCQGHRPAHKAGRRPPTDSHEPSLMELTEGDGKTQEQGQVHRLPNKPIEGLTTGVLEQ
jgi:hypothetical protein